MNLTGYIRTLSQRSFKLQLTMLFVIGFTLLCVGTSIITSWTTGIVVTDDFKKRGIRLTEELVNQSSLALLYSSEDSAKEVLERFKTFQGFQYAAIYDLKEEPLFELGDSSKFEMKNNFKNEVLTMREGRDFWHFNAPVVVQQESESPLGEMTSKEEHVGYVCMVISTAELEQIKSSIIYSNFVISFLLSILLFFLLQVVLMRVTRPLHILSQTMRKAENDEKGLRVEFAGAKEINLMGKAFNKMMTALEERETNLHQEIATRKEAELALRKSEQRFRVLTTVSPVGVFYSDLNGQCLYANERWLDMTSSSEAETSGNAWFANVMSEDKEKVELAWAEAVTSKQLFKAQFRFSDHSGNLTWVLGEATPETDDGGQVISYVGTLTDITKTYEAEEKVRQHQHQLAHFSRLKTMGEMASGMAHELNQPLAAIVNYSGGCMERLKNENISPDILNAMERISTQAERAGEIIHRLKDFLRKNDSNYEGIDVNKCIHGITKLIEIETTANQVELNLELSENLDKAKIDKVHFEQVLMNLSQNAIDAMVSAQSPQKVLTIRTSEHSESDEILVQVADSGPGIAREIINQIFDPFFTTKSSGMGMGLSIISSIIDNHEGHINVDSEDGRGATFNIYLPKEDSSHH